MSTKKKVPGRPFAVNPGSKDHSDNAWKEFTSCPCAREETSDLLAKRLAGVEKVTERVTQILEKVNVVLCGGANTLDELANRIDGLQKQVGSFQVSPVKASDPSQSHKSPEWCDHKYGFVIQVRGDGVVQMWCPDCGALREGEAWRMPGRHMEPAKEKKS